MLTQFFSVSVLLLTIVGIVKPQTITGTYQLHSLRVKFENRIRQANHADDLDINGVYAKWVLLKNGDYVEVDENLDGKVDLKRAIIGGKVGESVIVKSYREATDPYLLINKVGIDFTFALNMENGKGIIPGQPEQVSSSYLFNETENCLNQLMVKSFSENLEIGFSKPVEFPNGNIVWGFGLKEAAHLDWFKPINPRVHYPKKGALPPLPGAPDSSWGMIIGRNKTENFDGTSRYKNLDIRWHAIDGNYETGGSNKGIDENGELNRQLGISVTADNVTIEGMAAWGVDTGANINVGKYPMINGKGFDHDKLDSTPSQQILIHKSMGGTWDGIGYIFDAWGKDDKPFSGDEPFQFTGYYLTANFFRASSAFNRGLDDALSTNPNEKKNAMLEGAKNVAENFGFDNATAQSIGQALAEILYSDFNANVDTIMAHGMERVKAEEKALIEFRELATGKIIGSLEKFGLNINDGAHDFDPTMSDLGGRLLMKIDESDQGGICIPVVQQRNVFAQFTNIDDWDSPIGPIEPLIIITDETAIPNKFELYNNYPNPFNPGTIISFDLAKDTFTELSVYNLKGQKIKTLQSGMMIKGKHHVFFDGKDSQNRILGTGIYFYQLITDHFYANKKMMIIK